MSPLLTEIIAWVRSQTIEPPDSLAPEDARRRDAATAARVLDDPANADFVELLAKLTVLRPPLDHRLAGPASHDYAQRRTGENGVFGALIFYRDLHAKLQRTDHDRRDRDDDDRDDDIRRDDGRYDGGGFLARWDANEDVAGR
jgi:hypothetical protein